MKVKKYIALTMQDAMKKIREEMGNDAVILNSKVVQSGGFLGLFAKKRIEVIAAMDPDVPTQKQTAQPKFGEKTIQNPPIKKEQSISQVKQQMVNEEDQDLIAELKELKGMLQSITTNEQIGLYPEPLKLMVDKLIKLEVNSVLRSQIMSELLEYWYKKSGNLTPSQLNEKEKELFETKLEGLDFSGVSYKKKYINVIGPTGVGKTTTLAKLAAECVLQKKKKVAFITTDTFRIAAIDQLKTYAKILNVPIEVCYSIDDLKIAKKKLEMYDYIFIDTAGRNFLEAQYVTDLQSIIDFDDEMETFLVLAATAKATDMLAVYQQFSVIPINKLIFTKLDETSTRGPLFDVMINTNKGVAYTTHGQNVPDDIEAATRTRIVEQILR